MPRPGPRPYECVRRAWHSDRHQPIRGSLIQEIFRVMHQIHSSSTKKNKEWQEILPVVVLKAEEILYSKAISEAEYIEFNTLRDRLVDAVNTILRLDDTTESGEFLQPCIEAALNLGCTPRKASRSQRHKNSTNYLSSRHHELSPPPIVMKNSSCAPYFWSLVKPMANALPSSRFSVYPLCYNDDVRWKRQRSSFEIAREPISMCVDSRNGGVMEKTSGFDTMAAAIGNQCEDDCDLALRLGRPFLASSSRYPELKVGSRSSLEETKSDDCSPMVVNEYSTSWGQRFDSECVNAETTRKRKANFSHSLKGSHQCWFPKLRSNRFIG
ncbi:hypothetical protein SDJN02_17074, partial [Cucurbita argyrosperma subsp. argyrosperma]